MIAVIKQYPLATLISVIDGEPLVSHLPVIYNEKTGKLVGHIDINNPQASSLQSNKEVTLIFKGPDCYISPSTYTTEQLPTWNYIIVHVKGKAVTIKQSEKVKQALVDMTSFLEAQEQKYHLDINDSKMERVINYIHAFEIEITSWEGKFKLSQDKCEEDQENAKLELIKNSQKNINAFLEDVY